MGSMCKNFRRKEKHGGGSIMVQGSRPVEVLQKLFSAYSFSHSFFESLIFKERYNNCLKFKYNLLNCILIENMNLKSFSICHCLCLDFPIISPSGFIQSVELDNKKNLMGFLCPDLLQSKWPERWQSPVCASRKISWLSFRKS